jgi:hypothetical protein
MTGTLLSRHLRRRQVLKKRASDAEKVGCKNAYIAAPGGSTMKAVIVLAVILAIAGSALAKDAPARGCAPVVKKINSVAAAITRSAEAYWAHRQRYVALTTGPSRQTPPDAKELVEQEKTQADPLKAGMPKTLASFKALVATAESKKCLSREQLLSVTEPAINQAKRVNFDKFPEKE